MVEEKNFKDVSNPQGKMELSFTQQHLIELIDSFGCCYFIHLDLEMLADFSHMIEALYGPKLLLTPQEWMEWANEQLISDVFFNEQAGLAKIDTFPDFFYTEPLTNSPNHWDVDSTKISEFWESNLNKTIEINEKK